MSRRESTFASAYDTAISPDTNAPRGYVKDKSRKDEPSDVRVIKKAEGELPGNEVEAFLNPESGESDEEK